MEWILILILIIVIGYLGMYVAAGFVAILIGVLSPPLLLSVVENILLEKAKPRLKGTEGFEKLFSWSPISVEEKKYYGRPLPLAPERFWAELVVLNYAAAIGMAIFLLMGGVIRIPPNWLTPGPAKLGWLVKLYAACLGSSLVASPIWFFWLKPLLLRIKSEGWRSVALATIILLSISSCSVSALRVSKYYRYELERQEYYEYIWPWVGSLTMVVSEDRKQATLQIDHFSDDVDGIEIGIYPKDFKWGEHAEFEFELTGCQYEPYEPCKRVIVIPQRATEDDPVTWRIWIKILTYRHLHHPWHTPRIEKPRGENTFYMDIGEKYNLLTGELTEVRYSWGSLFVEGRDDWIPTPIPKTE